MEAQQSNEPILDLVIAAQYANAELHSITSQFASSTVTEPKAVVVTDDRNDESDSDSSEDGKVVDLASSHCVKMEKTDESSGDDSDKESEDPIELRAEIEAAMEKEANKVSAPLTTEHELVLVPVREPKVELTLDCPIAQCGSILNMSVPGLMMTVKSNPYIKPLDEGSVLCLEDRTVLGCVDEVFGPVLMPMYLIRFESAEKMPKTVSANAAVYYATEHTTYIVPEKIKDKGTDASNIFDEEMDETEFSDDEEEAAAKRGNRKRNRGGGPIIGKERANSASVYSGRGGRTGRGGRGNRVGKFTDYHARPVPLPNSCRVASSQQPPIPIMSLTPAMQTQPFGGVTKYTQPGGFGMVRPMLYGSTNYTSPRGHGVPIGPVLHYNGVSVSQGHIPAPNYFQPPLPPHYGAHNLPPYPLQGMYQQYPHSSVSPSSQLQRPPPPDICQPHSPLTVLYSQPQPPRYIQPPHGAPPPTPDLFASGQQQQD